MVSGPTHFWGPFSRSKYRFCRIFTEIYNTYDYGSFFSHPLSKFVGKNNTILASCLRSVIGALRSTPVVCLETECSCPPLEVRSKWIASKFLLKSMSNSFSSVSNLFYDLCKCWRCVVKSLPILVSVFHSFSNVLPHVICSKKRLFLHKVPFDTSIYTPSVSGIPKGGFGGQNSPHGPSY